MNEELGLVVVDSKVVVSSRVVAEVFEKRHDNILREIKNLECTSEFTALNFEGSTYCDITGRSLPEVLMTRDGFTILAMGFTGPKAMRFKEAYINAFNKMEAELRNRYALKTPQTYPEALRALAKEYEERAIAEAERDKAVREKAWISEKREATAMGKLSVAVKKINTLENQLGIGTMWKSVRAIKWLDDYFWNHDGAKKAVGHALSRLSAKLEYEAITDHSRNSDPRRRGTRMVNPSQIMRTSGNERPVISRNVLG